MVEKMNSLTRKVTIGLVGKYVELKDAYISISEALGHGGLANSVRTDIKWIHSEKLNSETAYKYLKNVDGIIVPGGFGDRGVEGKIIAAQYAREKQRTLFGHLPGDANGYRGICPQRAGISKCAYDRG